MSAGAVFNQGGRLRVAGRLSIQGPEEGLYEGDDGRPQRQIAKASCPTFPQMIAVERPQAEVLCRFLTGLRLTKIGCMKLDPRLKFTQRARILK